MKKKLVFSSLLASAFLVACGSENGTEETAQDSAEQTEQAEEIEETSNEDVLTISAIPDFDQAELTRAFDDFAAYLSEETGLEVEYVPVVDYASVVTSFERGDIDLAWFGGLTGVQARNAVPEAEAIAQRPLDAEFQSIFIKQADSDISELQDLEGASFAFGSESSTSGHLMPRYFLDQEGIIPEEDFNGEPLYSGSHDQTINLVEAGSVEAGVVNEQYWEDYLEEAEDPAPVEEFYVTPEYYDYNWTINNIDDKFGEGTKEAVTEAIFSATPEDSEVLELLSTEEFIETENENYEEIENVAVDLGIIQ